MIEGLSEKGLAEAYPEEQERCRMLLTLYHDIGPAGAFGAAMIEGVLQEADRAAAEQDVVAMVRAYQRMKECK